MILEPKEVDYLQSARIARMGTIDRDGRPRVLPICFVLFEDDRIISPIDEKPKKVQPEELNRIRSIDRTNSVSLLVDHYTENWSNLGWLQILGDASILPSGDSDHAEAVFRLREKYAQYESHFLERLPMIDIRVTSAISWGTIDRSK